MLLEFRPRYREILPVVRSAALLSRERAPRDQQRDRMDIAQLVLRQWWIFDPPERVPAQNLASRTQTRRRPHDPAIPPRDRPHLILRRVWNLDRRARSPASRPALLAHRDPGPRPEYQPLQQRIARQPICAVNARAGYLA